MSRGVGLLEERGLRLLWLGVGFAFISQTDKAHVRATKRLVDVEVFTSNRPRAQDRKQKTGWTLALISKQLSTSLFSADFGRAIA